MVTMGPVARVAGRICFAARTLQISPVFLSCLSHGTLCAQLITGAIVDKEQEHGSPFRQPNSGNHASLLKIQSGLLKPTKSLP